MPHGILPGIHVGIDVGGTFTDLVAVSDGRLLTAKVPSTTSNQTEGAMAALESSGLDPQRVASLAHGTTVATNALLERRGARTAILVTEGFRDLLEIGRQTRPSLYDLRLHHPPPLAPRSLRFTVHERMGKAGVVTPLDEASVDRAISAIRTAEVEAVALCFLFGYLHPEHELRVGNRVRSALPGIRVSLSSEVLPEFREYERLTTTVADAYLAPRLATYLDSLAEVLDAADFPTPVVMQSSGGVTTIAGAIARAAACVLSGPAAGVVGAAFIAEASGYGDALTFDMGGTSTDVAAITASGVQVTTQSVVAGVPIRFPSVDVHSVSAGGGSIAWADEGGALRVGPLSSAARPGPASYGLGGSNPTVTDANLFLGYLADGSVLGGEVRLQRELAGEALAKLGGKLGLSPLRTALGVVRLADVEMASALRIISVERGLDPREFALVAFGGAGPLHACSLAEELDIPTILVPNVAGVLSALGLAISDQRQDLVSPYRGDLSFAALERDAAAQLPEARLERFVDARYRGQAFELTVSAEDPLANFHAAHERRYGFRMDDDEIELVNLRVVATVARERPHLEEPSPAEDAPTGSRRACFSEDDEEEVMVFNREGMGVGSQVVGPAIVEFPHSTCLVRPGWSGEIDPVGVLILERK